MQKRFIISSLLIVALWFCSISAFGKQPSKPSSYKNSWSEVNWYQYGFRVGLNFSLNSEYSATDQLDKMLSAEFQGFVRFGKIIYAEIGLGYMFQKGTYEVPFGDNLTEERIETRYLQIPLKAVAYLPLSQKVAFTPNLGVIYQPLIQVTKNTIGYSKDNISKNPLLFTAGIGLKIHFVTVDVAYQKSFTSFFSDRTSTKPDFINVKLGFQL